MSGISLLEVIVSAGILFLVMVLLLNLVTTALHGTVQGEQRLAAEGLALSILEEVRSLPFERLEDLTHGMPEQKLGRTVYHPTLSVRSVTGFSPAQVKEIKVAVEWESSRGRMATSYVGYVTPLLK